MKAKELLSLLISIEDELTTQYNKFCIGDIERKTYQKRSEKIIQKQIDLINQFKKRILISYTHWLWKQRFAEMVGKIGIDKIVDKYFKQK